MGRRWQQWMPFRPPLLPADEPKLDYTWGWYKYIISYINLLNWTKPFKSDLGNICARPPATQTAWIHWIHAAGGVSGSITMVVVFVSCLCCCGLTRDDTSSSYVKNGTKISLRWGLRHYFLIHLGMHYTWRDILESLKLFCDACAPSEYEIEIDSIINLCPQGL